MAQDRITLKIRAADHGGDVLLTDFNKEISAFARALEHADTLLSGVDRRTTEFRVVDLHHSTATVVIGAVPLDGERDARKQISDEFFQGLLEIKEYSRAPKRFTAALVESLREMTSPVGFGVAETLISWGDHAASITVEFKKRIQDVSLPDDSESGEMSGMMEMVNLHNKENKFRLYPIIGPRQITCSFEDKLLTQIKEGLGRYIISFGTIFYKYGEKYPYRMEVSSIEIPEDESELPTFRSLQGIAPNMTDGLPAEAFVRQIRDEWD